MRNPLKEQYDILKNIPILLELVEMLAKLSPLSMGFLDMISLVSQKIW